MRDRVSASDQKFPEASGAPPHKKAMIPMSASTTISEAVPPVKF
jgi:hypothetical protein